MDMEMYLGHFVSQIIFHSQLSRYGIVKVGYFPRVHISKGEGLQSGVLYENI